MQVCHLQPDIQQNITCYRRSTLMMVTPGRFYTKWSRDNAWNGRTSVVLATPTHTIWHNRSTWQQSHARTWVRAEWRKECLGSTEDHWEDVQVSSLDNGTTGYRPAAMLRWWCWQGSTCTDRWGPWTKSPGLMSQNGIMVPFISEVMDVAGGHPLNKGNGSTPEHTSTLPGWWSRWAPIWREQRDTMSKIHTLQNLGTAEILQ
jgi:hypothetical protein